MISEKIKMLRTQKGLSQDELAVKLGVVRQTVSKWEKGLSAPDSQMLISLAAELGVSVSFLLGEDEVDALPIENTKESVKPKRHLRVWEIVILVLGSPIWLSLLIAVFAVALSLYISLWAVIISLWAVFGSVIGCAFGGVVAGIVLACYGNALTGVALIGAGIVCAGLSIFFFYGCKVATKGVLILTKKMVFGIKNCFIKKGEA